MPRFLRTIRFDDSDAHVFEQAAEPGEWAVPGGFAFCELAPEEITGKRRQAFANGFLSLAGFGRATLVAVSTIEAEELEGLVEILAGHFVSSYGAPDLAAARPVARGEIDFARELAQSQPLATVLAVRREHDETGGIREAFRTVRAPQGADGASHARIWDVVEDGDG